jgi:hypothetical protein
VSRLYFEDHCYFKQSFSDDGWRGIYLIAQRRATEPLSIADSPW